MQLTAALVLLATGFVLGEAEPPASESNGGPYPPSGSKPSGRLLLLAARQQAAQEYSPTQEYGPPAAGEEEPANNDFPSSPTQEEESSNLSTSSNNGFSSQQIQQQPGVTSGVYHVLLPDGRLQRVEFTTAPLKSDAEQSRFTGPTQQHQQQVSSNNNNNNNYQFQQQSQNNNQQFQYQQSQSGNYEQAPAQQFSFPSSFPQPAFEKQQSQSNVQNQGNFGQSVFQKPSFQQGQFGLNTVQQSQHQQNQFGRSSFQAPQNEKFQQSNQFNQDRFGAGTFAQPQNTKFEQQNQYPSYQPRPDNTNYTPDALKDQSNQKKYNKQPQGTQSQNKGVSTDVYSEPSSRFANAQPQPQVFEYQQIYLAQQQQTAEAEGGEPASAAYVSNVQYKDVEPIPSPIYAYNPAPLVRILRRTE